MGVFPGTIADKHKFEGIGKAGATGAFLWLSTSQPWLTSGLLGKIVYWSLTKMFSGAASTGLVLANVGVEAILTHVQEDDFNQAFDEAFKIINAKGPTLPPEEGKAIDDKVKAALRKFADMSRNK